MCKILIILYEMFIITEISNEHVNMNKRNEHIMSNRHNILRRTSFFISVEK